MIKKYGKATKYTSRGGVEQAVVRCQGCGAEICSIDCRDVDYSVTTRRSALFWHTECFGKVWSHGIV